MWFPSPNSYTGEDLAELQIHGSNAVINALLRVLSEQKNCRLAEPGEFTKIAFQNDKIDLLKAESIGDLIHAETELQRSQAVKLVQGNASNYYNDLRKKLIKSLSYIEAKIDFAEEDLPEKVLKDVHKSIKEIHTEISKIIEDNKIIGSHDFELLQNTACSVLLGSSSFELFPTSTINCLSKGLFEPVLIELLL